MKKWLKELLSSSDDTSHKRTISILSFTVLTIMVVLNAFGITISKDLIFVFGALCGGNSLMSVIEKFKGNDKE